MLITAILNADPDGGYTALNPETGTVSQGETVADALANLREATELYLSEFPMDMPSAPLVTTLEISAEIAA